MGQVLRRGRDGEGIGEGQGVDKYFRGWAGICVFLGAFVSF